MEFATTIRPLATSVLALGRMHLSLKDIPERSKYFRDPVHGLIEVDPKARFIVDSQLFQRLRSIKQLAFTHLVYHGAEHSRFGHSLGVYHLARTLVDRLGVNDSDVADEFCLAALLHDVGHFPFSHSFESVAKSYNNGFSHERYTETVVQESEISDRLNKINVDPKHVVEFLRGTSIRKPEFVFLNSLLDSELDIDRLDFLLRDSHYCGVTYGTYDLDRLILSMKPHNQEVIITRKGIQSVEIYILARFSMYLQVYVHHTRRAFDLMLKSIFPKESFESLGYPEPRREEIDQIVGFDDSWLLGEIRKLADTNNDSLRSSLAVEFLKREPIRWVCECLAFTDILEPGKRAMPAFTTLSNFCESIARKEIDCTTVPLEEIWGDEPFGDLPFENRYRPFSYRGESEKGIIRVWPNPDEEPIDIAEVPSSLASFLARNMAQIVRIYATKRNRIALRNYMKRRYSNIKEIIWCPIS